MSDTPAAADLLRQDAPNHGLPARILARAAEIAGGPTALYVMDVDGSRLHLLAASAAGFPDEVPAAIGVGPEIPLEAIDALNEAVCAGIDGAACAPLVLSDRALGALVARAPGGPELEAIAAEAALALELVGGYTDVVHATRRRRRPHAAAEIQQNLLPPRLARVTRATLAGGVLPGYEVGGDFFDYADNADGLWLTIADAVGKGSEAAALSSLAIGALRSARRSGAPLPDAVRAMHEAVRAAGRDVPFITAVCAVWDTNRGELRWITAGHPRPVVVGPDGSLATLEDGATQPLGLAGHAPAPASATLAPGSRLVLYSDGVVEQPARDTREPFGVERLHVLLRETAGISAAAAVRRIQDSLVGVSEGVLRDDATLLVVDADPR